MAGAVFCPISVFFIAAKWVTCGYNQLCFSSQTLVPQRFTCLRASSSGIEACIAAPNTVEAEIEAKELARIIEAFLDTLTTENRVIFMRRYWFSDSYKDIAEFMGLSEKNISVRLTRIREKMKQYLIEREVFV